MRTRLFETVALVTMLGSPAWSHHNMTGMYDLHQRFERTGNLTRIDWRNPHIFLLVHVINDAGEVEVWSFEGPPPNFFLSRAVDKNLLETSVNKTVKVEASRARNGSLSGLIRQITLADGTVVSACPQNC